MVVKVLIKRTVTESSIAHLDDLLRQMRTVCLTQPGYISGQTLKRLDKPGEFLVISVWESLEAWENWFDSSARNEIQSEIDDFLGNETSYEIYT
ncbi:MAG: antibiotic biosynthesis monooxygenase [Desulfofustis sp.]|jgi:heme oxygenase (mycobilin-producing)